MNTTSNNTMEVALSTIENKLVTRELMLCDTCGNTEYPQQPTEKCPVCGNFWERVNVPVQDILAGKHRSETSKAGYFYVAVCTPALKGNAYYYEAGKLPAIKTVIAATDTRLKTGGFSPRNIVQSELQVSPQIDGSVAVDIIHRSIYKYECRECGKEQKLSSVQVKAQHSCCNFCGKQALFQADPKRVRVKLRKTYRLAELELNRQANLLKKESVVLPEPALLFNPQDCPVEDIRYSSECHEYAAKQIWVHHKMIACPVTHLRGIPVPYIKVALLGRAVEAGWVSAERLKGVHRTGNRRSLVPANY